MFLLHSITVENNMHEPTIHKQNINKFKLYFYFNRNYTTFIYIDMRLTGYMCNIVVISR